MRMLNKAVVVAAVLLTSNVMAQNITGKVIGIMDGDTIDVLQAGNEKARIRFAAIDAPEGRMPYGSYCKQQLASMIFGKQVEVAVVDTDRYGRFVGVVTAGGSNINLAQVRLGCAWAYKQYLRAVNPSLQQALLAEEDAARQARRGLWSESNPVAPWDFRHGQ